MRWLLAGLAVLAVMIGAALVWHFTHGGSGANAELARDRAAVHFGRNELAQARAELAPLVAARDAALEDLVRAAIVEYVDRPSADPTALFERIRARAPENAALHYMQARLALEAGRFEEALEHFDAALRAAPGDYPTRVGRAVTLEYIGRTDEARALFREMLDVGLAQGGPWYVWALYRMSQIAAREGPAEEALQLRTLHAQLLDLGYRSPDPHELDRGWLATLQPARPPHVAGATRSKVPDFAPEPPFGAELAEADELVAADADGDGDLDLVGAGPRGIACALHAASGYDVEIVVPAPARLVRVFDLGNDDTLDLFAARESELVLLEARSGADVLGLGPERKGQGRWTPSPLALPRLPAPPADMLLVDFDHEGDLDLLVVGPFGAYLLRDDGAAQRPNAPRGTYTEVGESGGLPRGVPLEWCASEDLDNDQDVDLLLGGPGVLFVMDNLRAGHFVDVAERRFGATRALAGEPLIADFDGDFRPDMLEQGPAMLWRQQADGTFHAERAGHWILRETPPLVADVDLDGLGDLAWPSANGGVEGMLAFGQTVAQPWHVAGARARALVIADLDADLDNDLALAGPDGVHVLACKGPTGHAARIAPLGLKDNRRAVGAVVEARTRGLYRRIYWRGGSELLGFGTYDALDVLRITWPNGVVQGLVDVGSGAQSLLDLTHGLEQSSGLPGSCPFLYSWDGERFRFVSDVLGGTPLGLPLAPGVLVPPDHDEFVLVRGEELAPRDGFFELQFTEELREVTYLDRIRLDVVDHPAGTEIFPNERFSFPPFPEPHVHTVAAPLAPVTALGSDGRDWSAELAAVDDVHAVPFEPLERQFLGLATPHWLELAFDPEQVRDAKRLRLVCTGWFYWSDASVNMASARTPGVGFVPPTLQLQGPEGTWQDAGPPLGFPAGKTKTMVVDVTELLAGASRFRLRSTLRLYWDSIRLAVDGDDALLAITSLEPANAVLWPRGFSAHQSTERADLPERFDWEQLDASMRWDQHPGHYTRYGETVALLGAIDDRFVILGSGDALAVRFDARALAPPAPGCVRDYLVFLDGWAKDRDPNTLEALAVEPLPFHGMSGYPYGPDECFPSDPEHAAWRAEWNTRPARRWIAPLAPQRAEEWALQAVQRD